MLAGKLLQRLLPFGLFSILACLAVYAIGVAEVTHQAGLAVQSSTDMNTLCQQARFLLNSEELLEAQYLLYRSDETHAAFIQSANTLNTTLQRLIRGTYGSVRLNFQQFAADHQQYIQQATLIITVLQSGDTNQALQIDNANAVNVHDLNQEMYLLSNQYQHEADQHISALKQTQQQVVITTPMVFLLGVALIILFWRQLHQSQRQLDRTRLQEIQRLSQVILTDSLTGLGNHRAYQEQVQQAWQQHIPFCLALLDLDNFKTINDEHGHAYGDHILQLFGTILTMAPPPISSYRLGGDDFALLLPQFTLPEARSMLQRMHQEIYQRLHGATLSIGVTAIIPGTGDVSAFQEQADAALYEAKRHGRNAIRAFSDIEHVVTILSHQKVRAVYDLLKTESLQIVFQPIWDLKTKRLLAVEALARPEPSLGLSGPQEAFEIAERIGLLHELDALCHRVIFRSLRNFPPDVRLFLNVCPISLEMDGIEQRLLEGVAQAELTPDRVVLEITEQTVEQLESLLCEAERLRSFGFGLALDDAGSGNSGLEMLSRLTVDFVKIDRSILVKAQTDRSARGVMAGILAMACETGNAIIIEGIETQPMLDLAETMSETFVHRYDGIVGAQGFLLGRPNKDIPIQTPAALRLEYLHAA